MRPVAKYMARSGAIHRNHIKAARPVTYGCRVDWRTTSGAEALRALCAAFPCFDVDRGLPFLDTYRTMCRAPEPAFRRVLEDIRGLRFVAEAPR
jgi:hypothetical protein